MTKTYKEFFNSMLEKKADYTITLKDPKDASKSWDTLTKNKIKFTDPNSTTFVFKKESEWDRAMDVLDDISVEYDFDG